MISIKPPSLRPGDLLGITAFSTPITSCSEHARARAYQRLNDLGFRIREDANCKVTFGHAAGSIEDRVRSLHSMFIDPEIKGILNFWGGFQSHQLLEYLDFDLIRKNPKAFIGYSDTTALQAGIYAKTGLVSFSGPSVITFAKPEVPAYTIEHFKAVLMNPKSPFMLKVSESFSDNRWYLNDKMEFVPNPGLRRFRGGHAFGAAIGGNIGTLLLLAGTEFWPDMRGKILFVEEDEAENSKTIDRLFTHLRQMGVFKQIAGLVVGRFPSVVGFSESDSLEMILDEALRGCDFPVITGADFGHTDPLFTIPIGIPCTINADRGAIEFLEDAVGPTE